MKILKGRAGGARPPRPDPNGPEYRNGVALVEADAGPEAGVLQSLARSRGRRWAARARERNAPRTLDLDLIAYGREGARDARV